MRVREEGRVQLLLEANDPRIGDVHAMHGCAKKQTSLVEGHQHQHQHHVKAIT